MTLTAAIALLSGDNSYEKNKNNFGSIKTCHPSRPKTSHMSPQACCQQVPATPPMNIYPVWAPLLTWSCDDFKQVIYIGMLETQRECMYPALAAGRPSGTCIMIRSNEALDGKVWT